MSPLDPFASSGVTFGNCLIGKSRHRVESHRPEIAAPVFKPEDEARSVVHMETVEKRAPIELGHPLEVIRFPGFLERVRVKPQEIGCDSDLLDTSGRDDIVTQEPSEVVEGNGKASASSGFGTVGPKQADDLFPATEGAGLLKREVA